MVNLLLLSFCGKASFIYLLPFKISKNSSGEMTSKRGKSNFLKMLKCLSLVTK